MTRQIATTLGSQDGRSIELRSHGAFIVVTARIMHRVASLSISLFGKAHTIVYLFILNMDGSHHRIP